MFTSHVVSGTHGQSNMWLCLFPWNKIKIPMARGCINHNPFSFSVCLYSHVVIFFPMNIQSILVRICICVLGVSNFGSKSLNVFQTSFTNTLTQFPRVFITPLHDLQKIINICLDAKTTICNILDTKVNFKFYSNFSKFIINDTHNATLGYKKCQKRKNCRLGAKSKIPKILDTQNLGSIFFSFL